MNRFYKYLKSFDSFILEYSKLLNRIFSLFAILVILYKLIYTSFTYSIFWDLSFDYTLWLGLLVCFWINHLLDAFIWRYVLLNDGIHISIKKALKINWKSLLFSISTPSRIGEIPARRLLLEEYNATDVYKSASTHFIFKPISFLVLFLLSLVWWKWQVYFLYIILGLAFVVIVCYTFMYSLRTYIHLIILNSIRVISYCIQHGMIILLLGISDLTLESLNLFVFIHSLGALIPHIMGTEILMKSALYELIHINLLSWESFTCSLFILWVMNIVLPALIALGLKRK